MFTSTRAIAAIMAVAALWAAPAEAQSPAAWRAEAQSYLQTCEGYRGDAKKLCSFGQSQFLENFQDAYLGRIDSWRNIAFNLTPGDDAPEHYGIRANQLAACTWRMSILFSASDDIQATDNFRANDQCHALTRQAFAKAIVQARSFVKAVHVVLEEDPKAPWNKAEPTIDKRCLDSRVHPFGGPDLPPFVPPPGCPKVAR